MILLVDIAPVASVRDSSMTGSLNDRPFVPQVYHTLSLCGVHWFHGWRIVRIVLVNGCGVTDVSRRRISCLVNCHWGRIVLAYVRRSIDCVVVGLVWNVVP